MDDAAADRNDHDTAPETESRSIGLAQRQEFPVAQIGDEIEALLGQLAKLHREPLDLRARQRLRRAEQAAHRIASVVRQAAADRSGEPRCGSSIPADTVGQDG
jgi:hypothetical protein